MWRRVGWRRRRPLFDLRGSSLVVSKGLKRKGEEKERGLREERKDCLKGVNSKNWCTGIKAPKGFRGDSMFMSIRVLVGKVISYVWI